MSQDASQASGSAGAKPVQPPSAFLCASFVQSSEKERMETAIRRLSQGEESCLSWVYTYLPFPDEKVTRDAATAVAQYVRPLEAPAFFRLNESFRQTTSMEWTVDWKRVDLFELECRIGDEEVFLWIARLGTFHPNGYFREACVRRLASDPESYMFLLLRLNDWVPEVRQAAKEACMDFSKMDFDGLAAGLSALEKVRRSDRRDTFVIRELDAGISARMRDLEPDINWLKIRKYDTMTRWALYRLLIRNQKLSKEEVYSLLSHEKDSKCLLLIMRCFIEQYKLSEEELDAFLKHKSLIVQRCALEQKYMLLQEHWPGIELHLLSRSSRIRETARYILRKHTNFDIRSFYIENLETAKCGVSILGLGETGKKEDTVLLEKYLDHPETRIVKNTLHALNMLRAEDMDNVLWRFLSDPRTPVMVQAVREIAGAGIRVGADRLYSLIEKTEEPIRRRKLVFLLGREDYWARMPYLLMLYHDPDEHIRMISERKIAWRTNYSHVSQEHAERIEKILADEKYQIPEEVQSRVRFDLKHAMP